MGKKLMAVFHFYKKLLLDNRRWLYIVFWIAVVSLFSGLGVVLAFPFTLPALIGFLSKTFEQMLGSAGSQFGLPLALALFRQNLTASLYDLFFGAALGVVPVFSAIFNFFILGFLAGPFLQPGMFSGQEHNFGVFILSVAPHGIFEIPATLISAAFGLRLGWEWLLPGSRGRRRLVFSGSLLDCLRLVPLVIALLAIAAFIEAFVTPQLVR